MPRERLKPPNVVTLCSAKLANVLTCASGVAIYTDVSLLYFSDRTIPVFSCFDILEIELLLQLTAPWSFRGRRDAVASV